MGALRVIDAGTVPALRSQALWHGIASAMGADDQPVLSFCRPAQAYVGIGYHRRLDEVDLEACRAMGLPVFRRQIGGGPVYLDSDQLFFQVTLPLRRAPAGVARLYETLLAPAVTAFRALGLDARLDGLNDVAISERKVSGTGAGQIGDAATVVGNVIFRFPHERMAQVLALPSEETRAEYLRLMRRHVSSLEQEGAGHVTHEAAKAALRDAYAAALGLEPCASELRAAEVAQVERWERRIADPEWLAGPDLPRRAARQVKVQANVWVIDGAHDGLRVMASIAHGVVQRAEVWAPHFNGAAARIEEALTGADADVETLATALAPFGDDGDRVLCALEPGLTLR